MNSVLIGVFLLSLGRNDAVRYDECNDNDRIVINRSVSCWGKQKNNVADYTNNKFKTYKMKTIYRLSLIIISLILLGCNNTSEETQSKENTNKNDISYTEEGLNFAMQTQKVLAKNLMNEIKTNGTVAAITFCSSKAYPLTDSMALVLDAQLKRVSDQARNPNNKANKQEAAYIAKSKELLGKGEIIKPQMTEVNGKMVGYYPILTNQLCLQCHGSQDEELKPETLSQIEGLYPNDKAIDYKVNELRGIWVVEMNKK